MSGRRGKQTAGPCDRVRSVRLILGPGSRCQNQRVRPAGAGRGMGREGREEVRRCRGRGPDGVGSWDEGLSGWGRLT